MINPINHWALRNVPMIHDEEAPTVLELVGRVSAKTNEVVQQINENTEDLAEAIAQLPAKVDAAVDQEIKNGRLEEIVGEAVLEELGADFDNFEDLVEDLDNRIDNIVAGAGTDNTEVVDARLGANGTTYTNLGQHVRALGNGSAFENAVRPGTVRAGRLSAGMFTGEMRDRYTIREIIPMAGHWNQTGYIDNDTLELTAHASYYLSDPIPCKYGDIFLVDTALFGNKVYPAIILDGQKQPLTVAGDPGDGTWNITRSEIHITGDNQRYIRFQTGLSQTENMRVYRISVKDNPDRDVSMNSKGYIHTWAKRRTDTVKDRAQIKLWFKLEQDRKEDEIFTVPIQLYKWFNLAGWTFRAFAATGPDSYDLSLPVSASGYRFETGYGLRPYFTVPRVIEEDLAVTHVAFFIDLLPAREDEVIQIFMPHLTLYGEMGYSAQATGYTLHGALKTDHISNVKPGAMNSALHGKRVFGMGDSLMAAAALPAGKSWFEVMAANNGMIWHNAARGGYPIAGGSESMRGIFTASYNEAVDQMGGAPDYFILQGGANDLRVSNSLDLFRTDVKTIVTNIRKRAPRCKILFVTNWRRSGMVNNHGLKEEDYVCELMKLAEELDIPYFNAYAKSINLREANTKTWADDGSLHFTEEANVVIANQIGETLKGV